MLDLSLIPVLGVLCLVALSIFVQNRRAAKVAEVKTDIERRRQQILRDDGLNDQALIDNLLRGIGTDQSVSQFVIERSKLCPGVNADAPSAWTVDQMEEWCRSEVRRGVDAVNRGLAVPAFAVAIVIVAVCVVATTILYQFRSGVDESSGGVTAATAQSNP